MAEMVEKEEKRVRAGRTARRKTCCCTLAATLCAAAFAGAKMPIIGWGAWDEKGASAERYAEARDAGFTHLTQWCPSPAEAKRLLEEAEKALARPRRRRDLQPFDGVPLMKGEMKEIETGNDELRMKA